MSSANKYVRTVPSPREIHENVARILTFVDRYDHASACDILFAACGEQLAATMGADPSQAIAQAERSASRLVEVVVKTVNQGPDVAPGAGRD